MTARRSRVACVGAGPAGLLLALLLSRAGHEVDVFERSAPGATYGFGVVFSEFSLARLGMVAPDAVTAVLARAARWDEVKVRRGGAASAVSHPFAAVERHAMLAALAKLAEEAGARLRFRTSVSAPDLCGGYDLVAAADGARSAARAAFAAELGAVTREGKGRYIWFGVDRAFDAMTFLFADSPYGVLSAHVYPYAPGRSTFLVEAGERTWRAAGFTDGRTRPAGWTDERAMAWCAEVFRDDLAGAGLLGNGSRWLPFTDVEARRWSTGRLALIGDAAHTAHFSVGSGTTMALDDAVELSRCLAGHDDVAGALTAFESERRPEVARVQAAAWASRRMWEHPEEHAGLDPRTLLLRLLTRTGQSSGDHLTWLDPSLPERLGRPLTPPPETRIITLAGAGEVSCGDACDGHAIRMPAELAARFESGRFESGRFESGRCPLVLDLTGEPRDPRDPRELEGVLEKMRSPKGILLRPGHGGDSEVEAAVELVERLAPGLDFAAVSRGEGEPDLARIGQMVLGERLAARLPVVLVCGEDDLGYGWAHVQARRVAQVWLQA
ncbi:FAD-dependent monooxygenase [Nonomuraea sp. NPDC049725]|uniref:FAD-dependent monooxygenase n=1 Tax=Nonomuraea sp. NPDC049725 TaxID=3154508 RepID=UPI0034315E53